MTSENPANRPILVGIDGSRSATDAVRRAAAEACDSDPAGGDHGQKLATTTARTAIRP